MGLIDSKFRKARLDQSPWLFHFINGKDSDPFNTLKKILEEKKLISSKGYICFSASPLTAITKFFKVKSTSTNKPMYYPYGLGFSRDRMVSDFGTRNVIYYGSGEKDNISDCLLWRSEQLVIDNYDFEYLREWRIKGNEFDFSSFPVEDIVIVAPSQDELNALIVEENIEFTPIIDYINEDIEPDWTDIYTRKWKGIAVDRIGNEYLDDYALSSSIIGQVIGEDMEDKLFQVSPLYVSGKKR